jgi:RNA polymerase sigma-70 factor (ECF subfamily)
VYFLAVALDEADLCRRFAPRIRLYGLRHLRSEAAAADLVQEVLVIAIEAGRAGRLREPDKLASFVLGTCRLVVQDRRRGERRRDGLLAQFGDALAPAEAAPPSIDVARVRACLGRLADRERMVIVMSFYDERDADEIAQQLGMTAGHVRVVRHRAVAHLRACIGGADA